MDEAILRDLGTMLVGATGVVLLARMIRIPSIVAYILAGLVLGPAAGLVAVSGSVELISEVGIILLLFIVGLELSLDKIREVGGIALIAGAAQLLLTGAGLAAITWAFGRPPSEVLFLAVALTFSSTVVVVKLLDQLDALDARHGRIAVGILLVQDLAVVIVLTFVGGLGGGVESGAGRMLLDLLGAFGGMATLLGAAALISSWLLPPLFARIASSQETVLVWSLAWCFLLVSGAELLGLSLELGAFIAGVTLAQLPYSHDLRRRTHPLMNFFVAIFFVTLGIHMELGAALDVWPLVLALTGFTLLVKPPLVGWLTRLAGERPRVALRAGLTLGQTSEFSFILAALALSQGLIPEDLLAVVAAVGLFTMGLSSISILNGNRLVEWIERRGLLPLLCGRAATGAPLADGEPGHELRDHIVVVGMNSLGRRIVSTLSEMGERVVAIDTDPEKLARLPCSTVLGNAEYLSVLEEAGLPAARMLVSALRIEDVNRMLAYRAHVMGVTAVIHAYDRISEQELERIGVAYLLSSRAAGIHKIAEALREEGVFGE